MLICSLQKTAWSKVGRGGGDRSQTQFCLVREDSWVVLCCFILKEIREQTGLSQARRWCDGGRLNWGAVAYGARVRPG